MLKIYFKNNTMSVIKWETIFISNYEFKTYLNSCDFIGLSMLCKLTRLKLKPIIFESFYINSSANGFLIDDSLSSNIQKTIDLKNIYNLSVGEYNILLNNSLKEFLPYINTVGIKNYGSHYHLLKLSQLTPQISNLYIYNITISLSSFKIVLNNLINIQNLKVLYINFIQYSGEVNPAESFSLPSTLKCIDWQFCRVFPCILEKDPQSINYSYELPLSESRELLFQPDHLPSLKKFTSHNLPISVSEKMLTNNPQLTILDFKITDINSIRILELIQNIKRLVFRVYYLNYDLNTLNLNFAKLTYLDFYINNAEIWPLLEKFALSSPNLLDLKVQFERYSAPPISDIVNKAHNLESLAIISFDEISINFKEFKPSSSLKYLEVSFYCDIYLVLSDLVPCSGLNTICFDNIIFSDFYLQATKIGDIPKPWRLVKINDAVKYYRIV
jgi:hypothetical protein